MSESVVAQTAEQDVQGRGRGGWGKWISRRLANCGGAAHHEGGDGPRTVARNCREER